MLCQKFDDERDLPGSRIRHLERELEKKNTLEVSSTSPKEPETRKRDDSATPGVGELRESGVKGKASGKKDGSSESLDSKGDLSDGAGDEHATVVDSPGGKEAEPVVVAPAGGGEATVDIKGSE